MIEAIVVIIVVVVIVVIMVIVVVVVIVVIASKQFLSLLLMKSASTPITFGGKEKGGAPRGRRATSRVNARKVSQQQRMLNQVSQTAASRQDRRIRFVGNRGHRG